MRNPLENTIGDFFYNTFCQSFSKTQKKIEFVNIIARKFIVHNDIRGVIASTN